MNRPNFFIVGAPKCGTTAIYHYLRSHRNVFFPRIEEPHFFAEDFPEYRFVSSIEEYLNLFRTCRPEHIAVGETSVFYLYSRVAIRNLFAFNPEARIIVMLRNPVEMVYSMHNQMVRGQRETEEDFEKAWRLQGARARGVQVPPHCLAVEHLQYGRLGRLGEQVKRLLETVPREQVKVFLLDDLRASAKSVYEDALSFLNVPTDGRNDFPRVNENRVFRFKAVARFLQYPPFPLSLVKSTLRNRLHMKKTRLARSVYGLLSKTVPRPPLSDRFRDELAEYFLPDIEVLERILDRDLGRWKTPRLRQDWTEDEVQL